MIFIIIFALCLVITLGIFLYSPFVKLVVKIKKPLIRENNRIPYLTVIIPAYNEKEFMEEKIKNTLSLDYPKKKFKVIVIDDGSTDGTTEIIRKLNVSTIRTKRNGKINALNIGIKSAKTDFVVITDADTTLSRNALKNAVGKLGKGIGAVGGITKLNYKPLFYFKGKNIYNNSDWNLRYKESLLDSTCGLDGKFIAFRKSDFDEFPEETHVDDFEMTFILRKKGLRCIIDSEISIYETPVSGFKEEIKQIRRRTAYTIKTLFRYYYFIFNPHYSYFGMFTLPFRRVLTLFLPFMLTYMLMFMLFSNLLIFYVLMIIVLVSAVAYKKVSYLYIILLSILLAWVDIATNRPKAGAAWGKLKR